jgi:hypothetical protein
MFPEYPVLSVIPPEKRALEISDLLKMAQYGQGPKEPFNEQQFLNRALAGVLPRIPQPVFEARATIAPYRRGAKS